MARSYSSRSFCDTLAFRFAVSTSVILLTFLCNHEIYGHLPECAFTSTSTARRMASSFQNVNVVQQKQSHFMGSTMHFKPMIARRQNSRRGNHKSSTTLGMSFLGDGGGIFGIGAPEIATTLFIGYLILGPQDLYKLVKEIGKLFNTVRTVSADATKQFEDSMENTIQLDELRQAQRELNDAFSFRRSINVDDEGDPFLNKKVEGDIDPTSGVVAAAAAEGSSASTSTKKKKKRRRKKVKKTVQEEPIMQTNGEVEDLSVSDAFESIEEQAAWEEEMTKMQKSRMQRLEESGAADWFTASEETVADEVLSQQSIPNEGPLLQNDVSKSDEQTRFASQLAGDWNERILANEDRLSPLSAIMDRLAILEEEKKAADLRLEEEFRLRGELEEKFYREKRSILEEAAAEVQADAYIDLNGENSTVKDKENATATVE